MMRKKGGRIEKENDRILRGKTKGKEIKKMKRQKRWRRNKRERDRKSFGLLHFSQKDHSIKYWLYNEFGLKRILHKRLNCQRRNVSRV
jgi:hypothetical protein